MSDTEPISKEEFKNRSIQQSICNFITRHKVEAYIKWRKEVAEINKRYEQSKT